MLDLQDQRIYPYGLGFKDDAARTLARQRGAEQPATEGPDKFMSLANTRALVSLVRKHMSLTVRAHGRGRYRYRISLADEAVRFSLWRDAGCL